MVVTDLVEVPGEKPQRTSKFQVIAGKPMGLDMVTINHGDQSVLHTKAIYHLHGNILTYCVGAPGQSRPTSLSTDWRDDNTLVVLKRAVSR